MTDYADLEKRLRERRDVILPPGEYRYAKDSDPLCTEAAEAIASLTREVEEARGEAQAGMREIARLRDEMNRVVTGALNVASFLRATAKRHATKGMRDEDLRVRLTDCGNILREACGLNALSSVHASEPRGDHPEQGETKSPPPSPEDDQE